MDARISPKDEVRVQLSTEVLKYKIMEELELINEIGRLYNVEHLSQYKIAGRYNVSGGNIQQILNGSIHKD